MTPRTSKATTWWTKLQALDLDGDGVPIWRDGDDVRRVWFGARWLLRLAASLLPGHTAVARGAAGAAAAMDRAELAAKEADRG